MRAIVIALIALAACGPFRANAGDTPALIVFNNQALDQATVYIYMPSGELRRIGVVSAGRADTLKVPSTYTHGSVNVVARMLGRTQLSQTGTVTLYPGEIYEVTMPASGTMMSFLPGRD